MSKVQQLDTLTLNGCIDAITHLKRCACANLIQLGVILAEVQTRELYKEQHETFEEFLGSPEVSISRSSAYKAIAICEFIARNKLQVDEISEIDPDKIYRIIEVAEKNGINTWLDKARLLSRSDLSEEVRELKGLPTWDQARTAREHAKEFLYEYLKEKKKIEPDALELEELIIMFIGWWKRRQ